MLKSKKFWIAVILLIVTNIGTAVGCMWVAKGITALHIMSVYSSMNFKKVEDTKLLLTAISDEIKKDPEQAIIKNRKTAVANPEFLRRFQNKRRTGKSWIQINVAGATVFWGGFYFCGKCQHLL